MEFRRRDAHLVAFEGGFLYLRRHRMRTYASTRIADAPDPPIRFCKADVAVESKDRLGLRDVRPVSSNRSGRHNNLLHRVSGVDPRSARRRKTGAVVDAKLYAVLLRLFASDEKKSPVFVVAVLQRGVHRVDESALPGARLCRYVEYRRPGDPRLAHGLHVAADAGLAHVGTEPVPPDVWPGGVARRHCREHPAHRRGQHCLFHVHAQCPRHAYKLPYSPPTTQVQTCEAGQSRYKTVRTSRLFSTRCRARGREGTYPS